MAAGDVTELDEFLWNSLWWQNNDFGASPTTYYIGLMKSAANGGFDPAKDDVKPMWYGGNTTTETIYKDAEVTEGGNYYEVALTNISCSLSGGYLNFHLDSPATWAVDPANPTNARWAVVFSWQSDGVACFIDLGGDIDMSTIPLTINFADSLFRISASTSGNNTHLFDQFMLDYWNQTSSFDLWNYDYYYPLFHVHFIKSAANGGHDPSEGDADPRWGNTGTVDLSTAGCTPGGHYPSIGIPIPWLDINRQGGSTLISLAPFNTVPPHEDNPTNARYAVLIGEPNYTDGEAFGWVDLGADIDMTKQEVAIDWGDYFVRFDQAGGTLETKNSLLTKLQNNEPLGWSFAGAQGELGFVYRWLIVH